METDGGGWTVFQRREDGSVDFDRNWAEYEAGFGALDHESWLGLSKIHRLTEAGVSNILRVDLGDDQGDTAYATYSTFNIGDSSTEYTLTIAGYSGTANDSMSNSNNVKFSTRDNDNDQYGDNCATTSEGAWWYNQCSTDANLNGVYQDSAVIGDNSVSWYPLKGNMESLQFVEMKLRPTQLPISTPPPPGKLNSILKNSMIYFIYK